MHNADTLQGKAAHSRVDTGGSGLPKSKRAGGRKQASATGKRGNGTNGDGDDAEAQSEPEVIHSRSVLLFSEKLGVTAKLDLVETFILGEDLFSSVTKVTPVEYKKGRPRDGEDGPEIWQADQMQLGLQILLLRENDYPCDEGVLYYRETRQRVTFQMTPEVEKWIHEQIAAARAAAAGPIPEPLAHSGKCPRCSLVSICLPDETAYLEAFRPAKAPEATQLGLEGLLLDIEEEEPVAESIVAKAETLPDRLNWGPFAALPEIRLHPPKPPDDVRRLIAPNDETKALYLNTPGHWVSKKGDNLTVKEDGKIVAEFRLHDLHHLGIFGPVQLSTAVVQVLCECDVPITWFTFGGWFYGMTRGHSLKNVFTRIEQFRHAADPELSLIQARVFIYGKIRNQRTLLMRNHLSPPKGVLKAMKYLSRSALHAGTSGQLLGIEGSAALLYFTCFAGMLKNTETEAPPAQQAQTEFSFYFDKRNRRPPRDPVNALLSLLYSLLVKDCTIACYAVGFDPYVGFLHQPRFGRPALALDLMEEFRPIVADSTALSLINNRMLSPGDFLWAGQSVNLAPKARKQVFIAYEKRLASSVTHPVFGYKVSYRRAIELQARLLAKCLTGEIEQYVPFTTR